MHNEPAGVGVTRTMGARTMIELIKRAALIVVATLALAVAPAVAQESELAPEHLALARKYVDLTDKSDIYAVSLVETAVRTMQTILKTNPDIVEPVDAAITKTLGSYKERRSELMDEFARVYALNFTMEELQEIVTFYETPVGQKLATANASLNDSLQRVVRVFQTNLGTEFFAAVRAELKANGYDV
jgi:uncharacterized protein